MYGVLPEVQWPLLRQIHASVSCGLILSCMMATLGFPAIALPQMLLPESSINFTSEQASWFATVQLLPSIPGALVGGVLCERIGPRRLLILLTPVLSAAFALMAATTCTSIVTAGCTEIILLTCRVVQGIAVAIMCPVVYIYTYEINDARRRGTMTGLIDMWTTVGFLLCYIFGCFFSWETCAWLVPLVSTGPGLVGIWVAPESPSWQARQGKGEEALEVLKKLRFSLEEAQEELDTATKSSEKISFSQSLRELKRKPNILAMFASVLVIIMKEISGNSGIAMYIVHIFQFAGVGLQSNLSSVVVGSVRLLCNVLSGFLMYNVSRKPVLIIGTSLAILASAALGVFFLLQSEGRDVSYLSWLPLVSLVVYIIGYAGAEGPFCWAISVEVLPGPVRSIGCGITNAMYSLMAFLVSKTFTSMQVAVGLHGIFWSYAASSILLLIVVTVFVPETFGLSMKDIQVYWEDVCDTGKRKKKCDLESQEKNKDKVFTIQVKT